MHVGCHGTNHVFWSNLSQLEQEKQIKDRKNFFKKNNIDTTNFSVCYPWGSYNKYTANTLKKLKIKYGLTSNTGNIDINKKYNKFFLPRFDANFFKKII